MSIALPVTNKQGNGARVSSHRALPGEFATDRIACITYHGPPHPLPKERMAAAME